MKKMIIVSLGFLFVVMLSMPAISSTTFEGGISGSYNVDVNMGNNTASVLGNVSGDWSAIMADDGSITAKTQGEFGGVNGSIGLSGTFDLEYDPETNTLTGTWTLPGGTISKTVNFQYLPETDEFISQIQGIVPTEDGGYPFNGTVYLSLSGIPNSISGTVQGELKNIVVSWEIEEFEASGRVQEDDGQLSGTWQVNLLENGDITGSASGEFHGTVEASIDLSQFVNLPLGLSLSSLGIPSTLSFEFPYRGTWQGTLGGAFPANIGFKGCWVEEINNGQGQEAIQNANLPQGIHIAQGENMPLLGGGMNLVVDVSEGNFPYPFSGYVSGGGSFIFDISDKLQPILSAVPSQYSSFISTIPTSITIKWEVESCTLDGYIDINQ